jgi:hypothetical protein
MLKRLKNIILIDETLPKEKLKKIISKRAKYLFFGGWLFSAILLLVLSLEVIDYNTTKPFVDFMGSVVPSIKNLDNYILHGEVEAPYFMSFYYSILWLLTIAILPICLVYSEQKMKIIGLSEFTKKLKSNKILFLVVLIAWIFFIYYIYCYSTYNYARFSNSIAIPMSMYLNVLQSLIITSMYMMYEILLTTFKFNNKDKIL